LICNLFEFRIIDLPAKVAEAKNATTA